MQNTDCKLWSVSWLIQNRFPVNLFYMSNQSIYPVKSEKFKIRKHTHYTY